MHKTYQKGAVSLLWAAVFVGVVTLVAMVALMSARYERNYFSEARKRITKSDAGQLLQQTGHSVANPAQPETTAVRKCMVDGKPVYSNVECAASNPTSRKVELHDTKGFEAPKAPAAPPESAPTLQDKMIEKAVQR